MNAEMAVPVIQSWWHARLPIVVSTGSFRRIANSIAPVISVREAAVPAIESGRPLNALHVVDKLLANTIDIRNLRITPNPDTVVDNPAKMLDKLAVKMGTDLRSRLPDRNLDLGIRCKSWNCSGKQSHGGA